MAIKQARRPPPKNRPAADPPPAPIGDNKPPEPGSIEDFRNRYADAKSAATDWLAKKYITNQKDADDLDAFRKQVRALKSDAGTALKNEKAPLDKQVEEIKIKWGKVTGAADRLLELLEPLARGWLLKEKDRIEAERIEAERVAKEAAEEAARVAARAERNPHSIDAIDAVTEAAEAAERAAKVAKAAAAMKPTAGGHVVAGGIKRSGYLKETEKLRVTSITEAVRFLIEKDGMAHFFEEAAEKAARAYWKGHPDEKVPGTETYMEAKAI